MRIAVAAVSICMSIVGLSIADDVHASIKQPTDIPAQPLAPALERLAKDRNFQIIYVSEEIGARRTAGAVGEYTPEEALKQLLRGTGLTFKYLDNNTITILSPASAAASQAPRQAGGEPDEASSRDESKPREDRSSSFWDRFRLAQVDQGVSATRSSVDAGKDAAASQEEPALQLEEVTVTATRRAESVEKVPISIQALSQSELTAGGIKSIGDLASVTPGLQFQAPGSMSTITTISIRGINTATGASVVGLYLDDTPIQGRLSANSDVGSPYPVLFDLSRVEVARGPQGTLFGAGSEAGTVRFIPNEPSLTQFSGFTHAELATTDRGGPSYEIGAAAGGPILDNELGFRVSAWTREDGGYIDFLDPVTGNITDRNVNQNNKSAFRAAMAFKWNDVKITPTLFYQQTHAGDGGKFFGSVYGDPSSGDFIDAGLFPEISTDRFFVPELKIEAALPFADLTATTSYIHRYLSALVDGSIVFGGGIGGYGSPLGPEIPTSPADAAPFSTANRIRAITQEVRLASNQQDAFVSWVAGVFFDHRAQQDSQLSYDLVLDPTGAAILNTNQNIIDNQYAAYGQADLHLTQRLTATLGERIAKVRSDYYYDVGPGVLDVGIPPASHSVQSETPNTPKIALSYQATASSLFYVSAAKGFRVGGGNGNVPSVCNYTAPTTYKSDYLWSYEVGAKNTLFGGRLQVDSSAFHIEWSQIQQLIGLACSIPIDFTTNGGSAASNGFDLALQALVTDQLKVNLAVGYANAYFTSSVHDQLGNPLILSGDKIGFLPQVNAPWNVNLNFTYDVPLPQDAVFHVRGEQQYNSRNPGPFNSQIPGSPQYTPLLTPDPPTHLTNVRLGYSRHNMDLWLFTDNLFNSHPLLSAFNEPGSSLNTYNTFRPRTVGLMANYKLW
jgi:iron complex outermembrane recepter protein